MIQVDIHCIEIWKEYVEGHISREEAQSQMKTHGDKICVEMFENGFPTYYLDDSWKGIIGTTGV